MRKQQGQPLLTEIYAIAAQRSVAELIAPGTSFRDPYPAFSAAISVQFAVAGTSRGGTR
jgi:hypothetical protein